MRISDWSSDVCSSDLLGTRNAPTKADKQAAHGDEHTHGSGDHDHGKGAEGHSHDHGGILGPQTELFFALICGALLASGFAVEKLTAAASWIPLACYLGASVFGGWFTLGEAIDHLRLKRFAIETLLRSEEHTSELPSLMR